MKMMRLVTDAVVIGAFLLLSQTAGAAAKSAPGATPTVISASSSLSTGAAHTRGSGDGPASCINPDDHPPCV